MRRSAKVRWGNRAATEEATGVDHEGDGAPEELASHCLHALTAASGLSSEHAVRRLVGVILAGLRPPR